MKIISLILHILVSIIFIIGLMIPIATGTLWDSITVGNPGASFDPLFGIYSIVLISMICGFTSMLSLIFGFLGFLKRNRVVPFTVFEMINSVYGIVAVFSCASVFYTILGRTVELYRYILIMVPFLFVLPMNVTTFVIAIVNRIRESNMPDVLSEEDEYSSQDGTMYNPEFDEPYSYQFDRR